MLNDTLTIAVGTLRGIMRVRAVYFLIVCVFILIGSAYNYDILSMGEHKPLMIDVSLVLNTIAAILVALSAAFEIPRELRQGGASTLLTKPLGRTEYLAGKLVGTSGAGFAICGMITLGFLFVFSFFFSAQAMTAMVRAHLLVMCSVIPMTAIAIFFSVFVQETLAALLTAVVIWLAHSTPLLYGKVGSVLYGGIVPDLNLFNLKAEAVYSSSISGLYMCMVLAWGIAYSVFALTCASLIFSQRDLK